MDRSDGQGGLLSGAAALNRRQFLRGVAATGAAVGAGGLITACSGSSTSTSGATTSNVARKRGARVEGKSYQLSYASIARHGVVRWPNACGRALAAHLAT